MTQDLYYLMSQAILQAKEAFSNGEVPVGAILADPDGRIIARAHNQPIGLKDPTAHAEILALRKGGAACNNYRLNGVILVVTIEPCLMCMGAVINARIARLVFGAHDPKAGAAGSLYDLNKDDRLNHMVEVISGIMEEECGNLMKEFFQDRRGNQGEVPKWS
ncbi:MAG: tRNA adenosine(34) deaminase TadA [Deltaproteobacteria bacterium]|uniref:tRNA-specific adenosine deaminase n=1 Tax=Candidatus Desulfacyla euxinica TaxID=2841693 RepID=A0A8J6N0K0_9DELT|nr:tRNA adenosine(34) deaminase TadA [Candidatus Desulfacyla euxinica]